MAYPVSKSKAAFLMTVEKMFREFDHVYFWTFTWPTCMPDWRYYYSWNAFSNELVYFMGRSLVGVRVWEVHPGAFSHGLHCHALLNRRVNIHIMRRLCRRYGLGVSWVRMADEGSGFYLAKYISKEAELSPGMRRWGTIGGMDHVRVNDIEVKSQLTRNIRWVQEHLDERRLGYAMFLWIDQQTRRWGPVRLWPKSRLRCVTKYAVQAKHVRDITAQEVEYREAVRIDRGGMVGCVDVKKGVVVPRWTVYATQGCELRAEVKEV